MVMSFRSEENGNKERRMTSKKKYIYKNHSGMAEFLTQSLKTECMRYTAKHKKTQLLTFLLEFVVLLLKCPVLHSLHGLLF